MIYSGAYKGKTVGDRLAFAFYFLVCLQPFCSVLNLNDPDSFCVFLVSHVQYLVHRPDSLLETDAIALAWADATEPCFYDTQTRSWIKHVWASKRK